MSLSLLIEQGNYVPDLRSDTSTQVYVGPDHGLHDPHYTPHSLVDIPLTEALRPARTMQVRLDALGSLLHMSEALYEDTGLPLVIISAYRSRNHQLALIHKINNRNISAKPGHSEHQLGLAIDIMGLGNARMDGDDYASTIYQRLVEHGHEYGRHQSYQYGLRTDGYYPEKWHRRYLGIGLATALHNTNQTLTQYFYSSLRPVDPISGEIKQHVSHTFSSRIIAPRRPRPATSTPVKAPPTPTAPVGLFDRPI